MRILLKASAIIFPLFLIAACTEDGPRKRIETAPTETASANKEPHKVPPMAKDPAAAADLTKTVAKDPNWRSKLELPSPMTFDETKTYHWDLLTTKGPMSFELYHKTAPMHVTSTIFLTELGYYDSLIFHRVIPGFMAQGGDPTGTGSGGPGYNYDGEFAPGVSHSKPGMLSMANAGPSTDGSQFFITFVPTPFLDGKHTIFGAITSGEAVLKKLEAAGTPRGRPTEALEIIEAKIRVE